MTIEYKWLTYDEINKVDAYSSQKNSEEGYILENCLYYPKKLNDLHNECYQKKFRLQKSCHREILAKIIIIIIIKQCNISNGKIKKLIPNIKHEEMYVLNQINLKLYLQLEIKLTKPTE